MKQEIVTLYKISMMKSKLFMLALGVFSFTIAKANATDPGRGKKDELNGVVVHSDTKKPLKAIFFAVACFKHLHLVMVSMYR